MKTCKTYNGTIEAYTPTELESLKTHGAIAEQLWLEQWKYQGAEDQGTCTGGKGLQVWYVGKGKRIPQKLTISRCDWVQGNVSAQRSKENALNYLKSKGISADYNDGWMD
jgi:hypothetical protein